jgi:hypothetical protein
VRQNAQNEQQTLKKTSASQIYALEGQVVDLCFLELLAPGKRSSHAIPPTGTQRAGTTLESRTGKSVFACDPSDRHTESRDNLGIKILHFSYINTQGLQSQLLSMLEKLNAKLSVETRTLHLLSPSTDDMDNIDKAFCFATVFTAEISDMLTGMPEEFHNGSASTVQEFKDDTTFWPRYTKGDHDETTLQLQIYGVLKKLNKTVDKEGD